MIRQFARRDFLRVSAVVGAAGVLTACGTGIQQAVDVSRRTDSGGDNVLYLVAPSGAADDTARVERGLIRLRRVGFVVRNHGAGFRRYQRFAGTDAERAADFQNIANGSAPMPKVLMSLRGGYGAMRILPHIDFAALGARMRERGTLFFGFSDVCAVQLALLAKSGMPSFAGPMLYGDFGEPVLSAYAMGAFVRALNTDSLVIRVIQPQLYRVNIDGVLWGGNLSVLAALAGSPYMPDIKGGILFLEDVGEQPYRIERMLQTLYLSGVLGKQQAVIFGDFDMGKIRDGYNKDYNFDAVVRNIARVAKVPVLTGFPFGHIADKATFALGAYAQVVSNTDGGYSVTFSGYPALNTAGLRFDKLQAAGGSNNVSV